MAQIVLSSVGQAIGSAVLPQGIGALGVSVSGSAIGAAIGGLAGRALDGAIFGNTREGPRIDSLPIMESREGAGIANVYGRMRLGGHVIWAARLKETRTTERAGGGKGGPRVSTYQYSASFAVALCEGEISGIGRTWANGEEVALSDFPHRLYRGGEGQLPDPLIEAIEGSGRAPAYRGLAYIVFEDLPLDRFGNRLPQLSFEIYRPAPAADGSVALTQAVTGVNLIPASGEFVYGTTPVARTFFPATDIPENYHTGVQDTDLVASLDQLEGDLPGVERVALTVGWFGSDLRAGSCSVRPGVENREKVTRPYTWRAGGADRDEAWRISRNDAGEVNYGGTPADQCVIEAIGELTNRGLAVTITPFLFMDVPPGNGLPDPYGGVEQAPFPWRGRITASDGTAAARAEISAFLGAAAPSEFEIDGQTVRFNGASSDWGYRRFILHHAWLAKAAGGVEAFLIGSEMAQLTRIRDDLGHFPFVDGLVALAEDVRSVLGPSTKISYAADWTEYGAYVPGDGSGDVLFPLDPLWGHPDVDFIGVDWYPPTGDWRQGTDHLDTAAGYSGPDDPDYLLANITGGEAFDWFYADRDARDAQIRTPIMDTAHGEDWIFRQKDLIGWWTAAHHERPRGNRTSLPTAWVPGSKPIRLSEIGFPAVDKGGNSPNLFYDPKSSESQLPPYSTGERDDLLQRRALVTALSYWQSQPAVEASYVWAWDARPWPAFPVRTDIWGDGANWAFGHWLNGRAGLSELGRLIEHMASQAGVAIDASLVSGVVDGFATTGVTSLRARLDPILTAYGLTVVERDGGLMAQAMGDAPIRTIEEDDLVETGPRLTWPLLDKPIGALRLTYINGADDYAPATVEIRGSHASRGEVADVSLPLVLTETRAETVASALLAQANETETAHLSVPLSMSDLNAGDRIALGVAGDIWSVGELIDSGTVELSLLKPPTVDDRGFRETTLPDQASDVLAPAIPSLEIIDGPRLSAQADAHQVALAVYGTPWARPVVAERRASDTDFPLSIDILEAAGVGRLLSDLEPGPADRWDNAAVIEIYVPGEALTSVGDLSALSGSGEILVQSENGWERLAYARAELIGPETYRLSRLVRGLGGSLISPAPANALCVVNDTRLVPVSMTENDRGVSAIWQTIGPAGAGPQTVAAYNDVAGIPLAPAHLGISNGVVRWVRRAHEIGDAWRDDAYPNVGRFALTLSRAGLVQVDVVTDEPNWPLPADALPGDVVSVREIASDGRLGRETQLTI